MGIQSWKRGVHTGNTIRFGGSCAQMRCLSLDSGLIKRQVSPPSMVTAPFLAPQEERKRTRRRGGRAKKVTHETKQSVEVEELEQFDENVFYSLNKKGRWNLPEKIRTEIMNSKSTPKGHSQVRNQRSATDSETRLDHDMTLVERHYLKRGSNCFAVHSTKLPGDGTVSKSKTYLNENSVLQKKTRERIRSKKRKSATPQVEKVQELPNIEIELSAPYPHNGYLQYSEKSLNVHQISKDTKQPSRRKLCSEEISDIMKTDADCNSTKWCFDTGDCVNEVFPGVGRSFELTGYQPHHKNQRGTAKRVTAVAESDEDSHVWFLGEFVQMPSNEFLNDIAEEDEEQQEDEEENDNKEDERVMNEVASDASWKMPGISEESGDWELLESEFPSEGEEFHEGDNGILGLLIEDALARRIARLQIAQDDAPINRGKNKKRNRTSMQKKK